MKQYWFLPPLLVLCLLVLVACGASEEAIEPQAFDDQFGEPRRLVCSDECAQRGQCGQDPDQQMVVLGHMDGPHLANHNVLFPTGHEVFVTSSQQRQAETVLGSQPLLIEFYSVNAPDLGKFGWVAGWCLALP